MSELGSASPIDPASAHRLASAFELAAAAFAYSFFSETSPSWEFHLVSVSALDFA